MISGSKKREKKEKKGGKKGVRNLFEIWGHNTGNLGTQY
jgi:hypothetical protein